MRRRCRHYRSLLADAAERGGVADLALRRHLRTCASCRRELAQHRAIGSALRRLAPADLAEPPRSRGRSLVGRRGVSRSGVGSVAAGTVGALGLVAAVAIGVRRRGS